MLTNYIWYRIALFRQIDVFLAGAAKTIWITRDILVIAIIDFTFYECFHVVSHC